MAGIVPAPPAPSRASQPCRRAGPTLRAAVLAVALALLAGACADPERTSPLGTAGGCAHAVPPGDYLYALTNVGRTLALLDPGSAALRPETCRLPDFDPVGPWFHGGRGYYLSRVDGSGAGANALVAFDPATLGLTGDRLHFPEGSNPNSLLVLPGGGPWPAGTAWVALRGSTFDNFAINGVSVVDLPALRDTAYCDLSREAVSTGCAALAPGSGYTSLLGFLWHDTGCGGPPGCAYAVVNNWRNQVRQGRLLALEPDSDGRPQVRADVPLGRNPVLDMVLDAEGDLWVVNNGGHVNFGTDGAPGTLQVLDTTDAGTLAADPDGDDLAGVTVPIVDAADCDPPPSPDPGCDPEGIYRFGTDTAWVTTFPDDIIRTVDLTVDLATEPETNPLDPLPPDPHRYSGPLFDAGVYDPVIGLGANGHARLGRLDATTGDLLEEHDLRAGNGPVSAAAHTLP